MAREQAMDARLTMHQSMVPNSRTPNKGSTWRCTWQIDGVEYSAESRNGAPHNLARILVEAGIPDQPLTVVTRAEVATSGYCGGAMTSRESATQPLHPARYQEPDFGFAGSVDAGATRIAQNPGGSPVEAPQQPRRLAARAGARVVAGVALDKGLGPLGEGERLGSRLGSLGLGSALRFWRGSMPSRARRIDTLARSLASLTFGNSFTGAIFSSAVLPPISYRATHTFLPSGDTRTPKPARPVSQKVSAVSAGRRR
jgi:hypothetical protein